MLADSALMDMTIKHQGVLVVRFASATLAEGAENCHVDYICRTNFEQRYPPESNPCAVVWAPADECTQRITRGVGVRILNLRRTCDGPRRDEKQFPQPLNGHICRHHQAMTHQALIASGSNGCACRAEPARFLQ
jgi:hypothetical protein